MQSFPRGTILASRYEVVQGPQENRRLAGGMGVVYLCRDHLEDKPVALKTFQAQLLPNRAARDRFLREGTVWLSLGSHPHIVRCYKVEHVGDGREVYLVLQWIAQTERKPDASLRSWLLPGKPLPIEQTLRIALHIVWGMQHATSQVPGFIHRDLKPENVLVGRDDNARVTDFGLVKSLLTVAASTDDCTVSDKGRPVLATLVVGTPLYMAPEQWEKNTVPDQRADIYALGCMLYEFLTGQQPVSGESLKELEAEHQHGTVMKAARSLPGQFQDIVGRCVAVDRAERFENWEQVEVALQTAYKRERGARLPLCINDQTESHIERTQMGWSYNALGIAYHDIGHAQTAQHYFERAVQIGKVAQERTLEGAGLGNVGIAYFSLGQIHHSVRYYEQQLVIMREIGDRRGEEEALGNLGTAAYHLGDVQLAQKYYEQALIIAKELGDRNGESTALGGLGNTYKMLGEVARAIGCFEQALTIAQELGDQRGEGAAWGNLGNAYRALGQVPRAIRCYEQWLIITQATGDRSGEGMALGNLGISYVDLGELSRAVGYHQQCLAIMREIGNRAGESTALNNLGMAYSRLGDMSRAIGCMEQELTIARELGDVNREAFTSFNLAIATFNQGNPALARQYVQAALNLCIQTGNGQMMQQIQKFVAVLQKQ